MSYYHFNKLCHTLHHFSQVCLLIPASLAFSPFSLVFTAVPVLSSFYWTMKLFILLKHLAVQDDSIPALMKSAFSSFALVTVAARSQYSLRL